MSEDTYTMPEHGWTCFFCGETFTTPGAARDHFGGDLLSLAGCQIKAGDERGLLMALRKAEDELTRYRAEDSDADRRHNALAADHAQALKREEERGYDKGVSDMAAQLATVTAENARLREALQFYANRETWIAVSLFADPPCGEIVYDFDVPPDEPNGETPRPGKRARAALKETNHGH